MKGWISVCVFATAVSAQSHDLKTEKDKLAKIEAAIKTENNAVFLAECEALLDRHRINALAWYTCGKYLLSVKESDPRQARSNAKQMLEAIVIKATEAIDAFNLAEAKQPKAPYVQRKQGIRSAHFD